MAVDFDDITDTTSELDLHIIEKIQYHEGLRKMHEAAEEYEHCARARDEIKRLTKMLHK